MSSSLKLTPPSLLDNLSDIALEANLTSPSLVLFEDWEEKCDHEIHLLSKEMATVGRQNLLLKTTYFLRVVPSQKCVFLTLNVLSGGHWGMCQLGHCKTNHILGQDLKLVLRGAGIPRSRTSRTSGHSPSLPLLLRFYWAGWARKKSLLRTSYCSEHAEHKYLVRLLLPAVFCEPHLNQ